MSLADELLAQFEEEEIAEAEKIGDNLLGEIDLNIDPKIQQEPGLCDSVRDIAKLWYSPGLRNILDRIEQFQQVTRESSSILGPVETDPEYQLIVEANNYAAEMENEIQAIYRFVKFQYSKRFPELDTMIVGPLEYVRTVRELGNDLGRAKNNEILQQFLTQATIMIVCITATTSRGELLTDKELNVIREACDVAVDVDNCRLRMYEYIQSRMTLIAPNLSVIVGASIAAKIMGDAGGLTNLSKMPACNVLLLGSKRITGALPHTGFIYYSQIVQDAPPDLRRKASRLVAAKSMLAARVDACHQSTDGRIGQEFREDIEKKLEKLQAPPPVKWVKPLPKPVDAPQKKRGGKRVRKMKERYAVTEFRKQANRMNFGEIENDAYQEDMGYTRGTIGKGGAGRIRLPQVDEKTKVRISKTLQKNLQKQQIWGGTTTVKKQVSGTSTSVAFTPLQGLEIINPLAAETRPDEATAKYFSNTKGFLQVKQTGKGGTIAKKQ